MSDVVVRGELGWERQKARHDEMRLRYWAKIVNMSEDRTVKVIYRTSKDRLEREETQKANDQSVQITNTWCTCKKSHAQIFQKNDVQNESRSKESGTS
jgi:hypothetical protein